MLPCRERRDLPIHTGWASFCRNSRHVPAHPLSHALEHGEDPVTADPGTAPIQRQRRYNTRNVASDVSRATIDPPLSRASSRYSTASAETRKPSRITGIPGG